MPNSAFMHRGHYLNYSLVTHFPVRMCTHRSDPNAINKAITADKLNGENICLALKERSATFPKKFRPQGRCSSILPPDAVNHVAQGALAKEELIFRHDPDMLLESAWC